MKTKNKTEPCSSCGTPTDQVCCVCEEPLHFMCGYVNKSFTDHGHKNCLKFFSNKVIGNSEPRLLSDNPVLGQLGGKGKDLSHELSNVLLPECPTPKWEIERQKPLSLKLYNNDYELLCVCYNEIEFLRARYLIAKNKEEGVFVVNEQGKKIKMMPNGKPETWDGLPTDHLEALTKLMGVAKK